MEQVASITGVSKPVCLEGKTGTYSHAIGDLGGMPEDFFTLILQRTVLGHRPWGGVLRAALCLDRIGDSGRLTSELNTAVKNPFSIKPRQKGTAHCYYNAVPALLDPKYALEKANPSLWADVHEFYKKVRNKILNGYQIGAGRPEVLYPSFDMFNAVYEWVHSWHDPSLS